MRLLHRFLLMSGAGESGKALPLNTGKGRCESIRFQPAGASPQRAGVHAAPLRDVA